MYWILFLFLLKENLPEIEASSEFEKKFNVLFTKCFRNYKRDYTKTVKPCWRHFHGTCWPETLPNVTVTLPCPEMFFDPSENASRRCNGSGIWERSNISSCVKRIPLKSATCKQRDNNLQRVYVGLCWFSLAVMVPSLILTIYFLEGKNERFNVHTNLILAFILRTTTFFIHHYGRLDAPEHSRVMCNIVWVLNRYFSAAEITWMLNEALLLLRKVVIIFDKKSYLKYYILVGWGSPFVLTMAVYLPVMSIFIPPKRCWSCDSDSKYMLVLYIPLVLILTMNFFALIYTVSVFVKRQRGPKKNDFLKIKKAIKGTAMLTPLLGVIYLMTMFHPTYIPLWYQYLIRLLYPMQGTLACLVYLTFSSELNHKVKMKYRSKERRSMMNGSTWITRSRNSEKSSVAKRSQSSPFASVDQSCQSQSSPECDDGPKCGCPDAGLIPAVNADDKEKHKLLETTLM